MCAIGMCDYVNGFLGIRAMLMNSISERLSECGELSFITLGLFMSMEIGLV